MPRLVPGLGEARATEYYRLAIECARESMARAAAIESKNIPHWAVAEPKAQQDPLWKDYAQLPSGEIHEDGLRFAHIHVRILKAGYPAAIFMLGGGTPQLRGEEIAEAAKLLRAYSRRKLVVVGLTHDGGAYLIGFPVGLNPNTWKKVSYATQEASEDLVRALEDEGYEVISLDGKHSVEAPGDLPHLRTALESIQRTSAQDALLNWLKTTS